MPKISVTANLAAPPVQVWRVVGDGTAFARLAPHVVEVERLADAATTRWSVLLNGSRVGWVQREWAEPPSLLRFEQVSGDFAELRGRWTLTADSGGTRLDLDIEFDLGVDGLAPLLDPIWAQSLRAHADGLLTALRSPTTLDVQ